MAYPGAMINNFLPYEEQDALEKILAHHGVHNEELTKALAMFGNWIRADERSKANFGGEPPPPFLLVLLGQLGLYTKPSRAVKG